MHSARNNKVSALVVGALMVATLQSSALAQSTAESPPSPFGFNPKMIPSLFGASGDTLAAPAPGNNNNNNLMSMFNQPASQPQTPQQPQQTAVGLLNTLSSIGRSIQTRGEESAQTVGGRLNDAAQQTAATAKDAQTGFTAAVVELGQGIRKLSESNPSLVPQVKSLYESVSSKLSGAASSAAAPLQPSKSEQLADQLGKMVANPNFNNA